MKKDAINCIIFGNIRNRPKRLIKLLISLDCLPNLDKISEIILNK